MPGAVVPAMMLSLGLSVLVPQSPARSAGLETKRWTIAGAERTALVAPPTKGKPGAAHPLIFVFHGHGGSSRNAARSFHLHTLWPEAIVVYPQGLPTPGPLVDPEGRRPGWQNRVGAQGDRDLALFDAMLASLKKEQTVDTRRIYATGHSNGGGFTYLLAMARPDVLAAVAPSSAVSAPGRLAGLDEPKPLPVFHVAGRNDPLVKFAWQERMLAAVRRHNGCEADGKPWEGVKEATIYASARGTPVVAYIHDGDHKFPTAAPALIVKFFQQHARKTEPAGR